MPWTHLFLEPTNALGAPLSGKKVGGWATVVSGAVVLVFLSFLCWLVYTQARYNWQWEAVWERRGMFMTGWFTTLGIAVASLALSLCIGTVTALCWRSRFLPLRFLARLYVEFIRGTPLLVQLLLGYYAVMDTFFRGASAMTAGVLLLSIFSGAYIAEIIRGGLESIGSSQRESAMAIGLTKLQMYRLVVFPQMVRLILPSLAGIFASTIKDSSLLYVITVPEFTAQARNVNAATYNALEAYIPLAIGYLIITLPISLFSRWLERRVKFDS